jgi:hypothetical protein
MNARDWLTLALRFLGFWVMISAVGSMASMVASFSSSNSIPQVGEILLAMGIPVIAYASMAAVLLLFASPISGLFAEDRTAAKGGPSPGMSLADVYQVGARALGVFCVISAVRPAGSFLWGLASSRLSGTGTVERNGGYLLEVVMYLGVAAFLILRSDVVVRLSMSSHRRVPATPEQHPLDA